MPSALAAGMLSLVGLEGPAMWSMGRGVEAILLVARWVAGLDGATRAVPAPPGYVIPMIAFGGLWLCIWTRKWRSAGAALAAAGVLLWAVASHRPELLISDRGGAIGLMHGGARAIDRAVGDAYTFTSWLQRDGDAAGQETAATRPGLERNRNFAAGEMSNGWRVVLLRRRPAPDEIEAVCREKTLVVAGGVDASPNGGCAFLGAAAFARRGAVAVEAAGEQIILRDAAKDARGRFWGGLAREG
jgi:competence protein ComEC